MGSGPSIEGGYVHSSDQQLWCSKCTQRFYDPRRLPGCGHLVCGPASPNNCANQVLSDQNRRCPVLSCMMAILATIFVEDLAIPDLQGTEEFLSAEYKEVMKQQGLTKTKPSTSKTTGKFDD